MKKNTVWFLNDFYILSPLILKKKHKNLCHAVSWNYTDFEEDVKTAYW